MKGIENNLIEWESFEWKTELFDIDVLNDVYNLPNNSKINIYRNEQYQLTGQLISTSDKKLNLLPKNKGKRIESGQLAEDNMLEARNINNCCFKLRNVLFTGWNYNITNLSKNPNFHCEAKFILTNAEQFENYNETCILKEFYLCGKISNHFTRRTIQSDSEKSLCNRHGIDEINQNVLAKSIIDYFYVKTDNFDFIVQKIGEKYLPDWANAIQIEYRKTFKDIPNEKIRLAISEILSFVLGTKLMKVGETHFDSYNKVSKRIAINPPKDIVVDECKKNASSPIKLDDLNNWFKSEQVIEEIVTNYLMKINSLNLDDFLWKYWVAGRLPIGTNLPIYASGLECLVDQFLTNNKKIIRCNKKYKSEYKSKVLPIIKHLDAKFPIEYDDFKEWIKDRVNDPFNISIGQKIKMFFKDIDFNITSDTIESKAINARNKMVHNTLSYNDDEIKEYIDLTKVYQTLMNRVFLKIIDYSGKYIDYYTIGFPERKIEENIPVTKVNKLSQ
jgi:hypothetical protein